jgi:hypothetical protein
LSEHINSLLGLAIEEAEIEPTMPADGEKQAGNSSDDEEMPETRREPSTSAVDVSADHAYIEGSDQKFDFLADCIKLLRKSGTTTGGRTPAEEKVSTVTSMSQLYQKIRSDSLG